LLLVCHCDALRGCAFCWENTCPDFLDFVALVVRMLTLWPMNVAGLSLKGLVLLLGGSLVGPVVAPEGAILVPVIALVGATLVEGSTMRVALLVAVIVVSVALIREMANLVIVVLRHLVAEFALRTKLNLLLLLLRERAVGHLQVVDVVKILTDSRECLLAEALSTLEVPVAVLQMKGHVKPLDLECVVGRRHVASRKGFS
jgi:hypothetical protein